MFVVNIDILGEVFCNINGTGDWRGDWREYYLITPLAIATAISQLALSHLLSSSPNKRREEHSDKKQLKASLVFQYSLNILSFFD